MLSKKDFEDFLIKVKMSDYNCTLWSEDFIKLTEIIYSTIKDYDFNFYNLKELYKLDILINLYKKTKCNELYKYLIKRDEVNEDFSINLHGDLSCNSHFYMLRMLAEYEKSNKIEPFYIDLSDSFVYIDFNLNKFKYSISYLGETIYCYTLEECLRIKDGVIKEKISSTGNLRLVEILIF